MSRAKDASPEAVGNTVAAPGALATGETVAAPDALATGETVAAPDALAAGETLAQGSAPSGASSGRGPVVRAGAGSGDRPRSPTGEHDWAPGARIGRYVVLSRIGKGGMGTVYRAEDVELGRAVALKRLHATASDDARARLVREARTAAQLQHPNVLTVHDVAEFEGTPFLAMELVDGVTLTEWVKQAPRTWREVVAMVCQAGRGLAAAHERGLVHRDFKPDNVLVDRAGRARVADFGLARAGDEAREGSGVAVAARDVRLARLTETGALAGTPAYMAPELVAGEPPDARSDQYALAITLYEALHGQHPFPGTTADALWDAMAREQLRPGTRRLPASLERHVRKGLAADPAARWPSVAAFVDALTATTAPGRRRWPIVAGGVVAIAALAGGALWFATKREQQPCSKVVRGYQLNYPHDDLTRSVMDPNDLSRVDAEIKAFEREARGQLIESCMDRRAGRQTAQLAEKRAACIDSARDGAWAVLDRIKRNAQSGAALAAALADLPELARCTDPRWLSRPTPPPLTAADQEALAHAQDALDQATALRDSGDLAGAEKALDTANASANRLNDRILTTRIWLLYTELARDRGDTQGAQSAATQAVGEAGLSGDSKWTLKAQTVMLATASSANPKAVDSFTGLDTAEDDLDSADLRSAHGDALMANGRFTEGEAEYRRVLAIREKLLPPAHLDRALALQRVGAALIIQKKVADARPLLEQSAAAIAKALPPLRRESIESVRYLAMLEEEAGNLKRALELRNDVLDRRTKVLGAAHPITLDARSDVARLLSDMGSYPEAAKELEAVIAGFIAANGDRTTNVADARVSLANAYVSSGRFADADATLALAIPMLVRGKGADSPYTLVAEYAQARSLVERPHPVKLADAKHYLDRAEPVFIKLFGDTSQPAAAVAMTRARLLLASGDAKQADLLATRATSMLGDDKRADRAEALSVHAAVLWKLGNRAAARTIANKAIDDFEAAGPSHAQQVVAIRGWLAHPSAQPALPKVTNVTRRPR